MVVSLRPDLQRFVDEQVKVGRFATADAVIEAAIAEMRDITELELDPATISAINEGEDQGDRGEGIAFEVFREQWKERLGGA